MTWVTRYELSYEDITRFSTGILEVNGLKKIYFLFVGFVLYKILTYLKI